MRRYALISVVVSAVALAVGGCGGKDDSGSAPAPPAAWTSAKYKMTTSYPGSWKYTDTALSEDAKSGAVRIVLFHKPGPMEDKQSVDEFPPYVKVTWTPGATPPAGTSGEVAPDEGARVLGVPTASQGVTAGWVEFGGEEIQTRQITFAGAPAEEGTALLKSGTALFSTYTGQLQGRSERLRVIRLSAQGGYYEITRIAAIDSPGELIEADQIVNSLRFTR